MGVGIPHFLGILPTWQKSKQYKRKYYQFSIRDLNGQAYNLSIYLGMWRLRQTFDKSPDSESSWPMQYDPHNNYGGGGYHSMSASCSAGSSSPWRSSPRSPRRYYPPTPPTPRSGPNSPRFSRRTSAAGASSSGLTHYSPSTSSGHDIRPYVSLERLTLVGQRISAIQHASTPPGRHFDYWLNVNNK